ncbi:hypothetical protein DB88DRAFT_548406 [Papiliotrema laurentii]|uniref:Uncharacterized protein n=1 Tax=Papiliotrema laurentii TaxID=5418 RepID=A0AAD9CVA6_PAPLA|nr:hypothetical protein DB88DRAFT_548406 [Papiliotrema laurentii]
MLASMAQKRCQRLAKQKSQSGTTVRPVAFAWWSQWFSLITFVNCVDIDLTRTLHSHSAQFYTRRELLNGPRRQKRTPWETKKRKLLETEGTLVSLDHVDTDTPIMGSHASRQTSSISGQSNVREQKASLESSKPAPRSSYKRRDMFRALDAPSIIALGR